MQVMTNLSPAYSATVACIVFAACGGVAEPEEDPPALPPETSFVMTFANFQDATLNTRSQVQSRGQPGANWTAAALTVAVWRRIITETLAAPIASFIAAMNQSVSWKDDHWEWRYSFRALNQEYEAKLLAEPAPDGHNWSMFISGPDFDDFNWFAGFSARDGLAGSWQVRLSPEDRTPFVDIQWSHDVASGVDALRYTNAIIGSAERGGNIFFTNQPVEVYDRWYQVFAASESKTTDIQWQSVTGSGRINGPQSDGSVNWRCWDDNHEDVSCVL